MTDKIDRVVEVLNGFGSKKPVTRAEAEALLLWRSLSAEDWLAEHARIRRENAAMWALPREPVPDPYENPQRYAFYLRMTTPSDIYDPAVDNKYELLRAALRRRHEEGLDTFGMEF